MLGQWWFLPISTTCTSYPETDQGSPCWVTHSHHAGQLFSSAMHPSMRSIPALKPLLTFSFAGSAVVPSLPARALASSLTQSLTQHYVAGLSFLLLDVQF